MSTSQEIIAKVQRYGANNYHPLPVVLTRGEGVWVWDQEGKKYMDMLSAYSALSHGHRHPRLIKAVVEQCEKLTLTSRAFHNDALGGLYERLSTITGLPKILPMNSGAEAVETAVKLARKWGYQVKGVAADRAEIVVCNNNFHGRTLTVISFSSEPAYREGFGPFTPGFTIIDYDDVAALEAAIGGSTVAFLVEPIQGEAGVVVPQDGYLRAARELCHKNNVLLMADEVQTGLGRTGKMFCCEHEEVTPDVIIMGKALGGGIYPVSAVAATAEVMDVLRPGDHGSTFGGNPLAAAIGCAALDVLVDEDLVERSAVQGEKLLRALRAIDSKHVREVRGRGLLIGVDLVPDAGGARRFCEALMKEGLLCKETHESVIRFAPPLAITDEEIAWAVGRVDHVLTSL